MDSASKNNLTNQTSRLNAERTRQLIGTNTEIPKTSVIADYGQINSINNDTRFGITQTVNFPTVYRTGKALQQAESEKAVIESLVTNVRIRSQIKSFYYRILILEEKEQILRNADSIYEQFLQKADLRFEKEKPIVEKWLLEGKKKTN